MLEMTNQQLVGHWLSLRRDVMAGVFFDDADNLSVLTQDGVVESFYSSSFFQLLDQCIVYLDDAHTRGTDLKLPLNFRAVVTLGPKVTKDRLVQGMSQFYPSIVTAGDDQKSQVACACESWVTGNPSSSVLHPKLTGAYVTSKTLTLHAQ